MARTIVKWTQQLLGRDHGALFRSLAAGNRFVFLEVGAAIACFIDNFQKAPDDEAQWSAYWTRVEQLLAELGWLDPSWLPATAPDPRLLRSGLRSYYEATRERDPKRRSELVLAGNLTIGNLLEGQHFHRRAVASPTIPAKGLLLIEHLPELG